VITIPSWLGGSLFKRRYGSILERRRHWVRRAQVDQGTRPGLTTDERARLKALEREVKDLRRTNAILQDASIFFATVLDGQTKK
jgi:transposase